MNKKKWKWEVEEKKKKKKIPPPEWRGRRGEGKFSGKEKSNSARNCYS